MAIHTRRYLDRRPQRRALMTAFAWLLILTTGVKGNALAGPAEKSPDTRSAKMTTETAPPTSTKTATFAMG